MSETPWMKLWIGDYLADTAMLSMEQSGAYLHLLMAMWTNGGWLPNDPRKLAWICRMPPRRWQREVAHALDQFFIKIEMESGDIIQNKRLTKELKNSRCMRDQHRAAANARWLKNKKANGANVYADAMPPEPEPVKSRRLSRKNTEV
jgi:uncharacterized protein YdaU (DUF1376 family)